MTLPATAITLLWQRQSVWSQSANRLKTRIARSRATALLLIIAGAVLGTASSQVLDQQVTVGRGLAAGAAVVLALASFAGLGSSPQVVRDWTRARSISEDIKADVYCYLAGVAPFQDGNRDQVALQHLDGLARDTADIVSTPASTRSTARCRRCGMSTRMPRSVSHTRSLATTSRKPVRWLVGSGSPAYWR